MSKIAFFSVPAHGHLNPTLPVVQELVRRGEEVTCYNTEEFRPQIEATGAHFQAYPQSILTSQAINESVRHGNLANSSLLMLHAAEALLPFTLGELEHAHPDLVLFDSLAVWGKIATTMLELRGAASISHFVFDLKTGRITPREILAMFWQYLPRVPGILASRSRLIRRYGKESFPPGDPLFPMRDKLNIVFTARVLQPAMALLDESFRFVGPSIQPRPSTDQLALDSLTGPLIYISLGTVHSNRLDFYSACFRAFAAYPARFILATGRETDMDTLGEIPANFTVRHFVPQLEVLQHAQLFISHGGMNSLHEALYYGVPLVVIPQQFEQLLNARCVEAHGAAYVINRLVGKRGIYAEELREVVEQVTTTPDYQLAAAKLQQQLRATGGYRQAADEIQAYIRG